MRVLFVSNGHGEAAIARRIARDVRDLDAVVTEHLALVGHGFGDERFVDVGPQRVMPSGGLVAMGNVGAFARDLRAGFPRLFAQQLAFLRGGRCHDDVVVAQYPTTTMTKQPPFVDETKNLKEFKNLIFKIENM